MQLMTDPIRGLVDSTLRQYGVTEEAARQQGLSTGQVRATRDSAHRIIRIDSPSSVWTFQRDAQGNVRVMTAQLPGRLTEVVFRLDYDDAGYIVGVSRQTRALPGRTVEEV